MTPAVTASIHDDVSEILLTEAQIGERVVQLGHELDGAFSDRDPVLVSVLKGSLVFLADLMRAMEMPVSIDLMELSSYVAGTETSGQVRIIKDL
jgi:hypoxanthine phosphoribosyltransferase